MPTYLAFGDSNTHGSCPSEGPRSGGRYDPGTRWPTVAHAALPKGWQLAEAGLPGRTTQFPDPVMGAHMDGQAGLRVALLTHAPVDLISIMIGTNDAKARFGASAARIDAGLAGLLDILREPAMQDRVGRARVLIIAPAPVAVTGERAAEWRGASEKTQALAELFAETARAYGAEFLDAARHVQVDPADGIHLSASAHRTLGSVVGARFAALSL